ncbi:MAG: PfkB family carbohydrate kinase [Xanthomonadales bacterium]|jgi:sulfofructose kinase|nr:PfkB family carbohydrate kinase [Xanthomonadales bacterium]
MSHGKVLCVGHAVQDFIFNVPEIPSTPEKHRATGFSSVGGGPAATAAVTVARLGGHALLAARIGADAVAALIEAELLDYGVDCRYLRRFPGCASSVSAVFVDQRGERLILNHLDRSIPAEADWLPYIPATGVHVVLADTRWPVGALAALTAARAAGLPAVLDADRPIPPDGELLKAATHVAFSQDALTDYTGIADPVQALRATGLSAWSCVTAGGDGVHVLEHGAHRHLPGFRVPVVDTLGAGDVWHGAFALALAEGQSEAAAVRFASAAAALKVQRPGGRAGAPTRAELDHFLSSNPR